MILGVINRIVTLLGSDSPVVEALQRLDAQLDALAALVAADRVFEFTFTVTIDPAATGVSLGTSAGGTNLVLLATPPALGANPLGFLTSELGLGFTPAAGYQAYFATAEPIWFRSVDGSGNHDTELLTALPARAQITIAEIVRTSNTTVEVFIGGFQV